MTPVCVPRTGRPRSPRIRCSHPPSNEREDPSRGLQRFPRFFPEWAILLAFLAPWRFENFGLGLEAPHTNDLDRLPSSDTLQPEGTARKGLSCYENPPHPPLPHAGGRARVGVAEFGQSARIFIGRGVPGRVMTTAVKGLYRFLDALWGPGKLLEYCRGFCFVGTRDSGALPDRLVQVSYLGYDPVLFECLNWPKFRGLVPARGPGSRKRGGEHDEIRHLRFTRCA